jgi:uncharacterized protein (DUF1330 family)
MKLTLCSRAIFSQSFHGRNRMSAYFVFHNLVHDAKKNREYTSLAGQTLIPHHAEILVFSDDSEVIEGATRLPRTVVIRFDSREAAMAWYNSSAYQKVRPLRLGATEGYAVLVEGLQ